MEALCPGTPSSGKRHICKAAVSEFQLGSLIQALSTLKPKFFYKERALRGSFIKKEECRFGKKIGIIFN